MFEREHLRVIDWILFFIFMAIPVVNIIVIIVVLAGANTNKSLKNYMWANLVMAVVSIVLLFTLFASIIAQLLETFNGFYS